MPRFDSLHSSLPEQPLQQEPIVRWDNTYKMMERISEHSLYEEPDGETLEGTFQGRPIISRDKPINGGVYVGAGGREAIVVDDTKDPVLKEVYHLFLQRVEQKLRQHPGATFNAWALGSAYRLTEQIMTRVDDVVDEVKEEYQLKTDQKVPLGMYIKKGGGVCRHRALLAGYLLERAIKEEKMQGSVSIDRNSVKGRGSHAWVRYTTSSGQVGILDAMIKVFGSLQEVRKIGIWQYDRPEDLH